MGRAERIATALLSLGIAATAPARAEPSDADVAATVVEPSYADVPAPRTWREHLAGELAVAVGFDTSSGDYGEAKDTDITYWPFSVGYSLDELGLTPGLDDQLEWKLTLPVLRIRSAGIVVGPGGDVIGSQGGGRSTESGLGDLVAQVGYVVYPPAETLWPILELSTRVKVPTAEDDLGTGETDVTVELGLSRAISRFVFFGSGGRRFVGDPPDLQLSDAWLAAVGVGVEVVDSVSAGFIYDWRESASRGSPDAHELVPYASWTLPLGFRFGPYGVIGLSNGSPDWGIGAQLSVRIGMR